MRLILRVLGTWLLGIGVVLLIIDGTRSLAVNALVMTPLVDTWSYLHSGSLEAVHGFLQSRFFAPMLEQGFDALLAAPGFAVVGMPGILLALLGRSRSTSLAPYSGF